MAALSARMRSLVAAVAAGIIITLATAWGGAMVRPAYEPLGLTRSSPAHAIWEIERAGRFDRTTIRYWRMQISGQSLMIPMVDYEARQFDLEALPGHLRAASLDDDAMLFWHEQSGFPLPALSCIIDWVTQVNSNVTYSVRGGILLPEDSHNEPRAIPLRPLWLGLAADVAIWSVAWLAAVSGARRLIGWRRARRGRCRTCGYALGGLPHGTPCPECGRTSA